MPGSLIDTHGHATQDYVQRWAATVALCWRLAYPADNLDPARAMVSFSPGNRWALAYNIAQIHVTEALHQARVFGYPGPRIRQDRGRW